MLACGVTSSSESMKRHTDTPGLWHWFAQASLTASRLCLYPLPDRIPTNSRTSSRVSSFTCMSGKSYYSSKGTDINELVW